MNRTFALGLSLVLAAGAALPADAAGVGFSVPKLRMLSVDGDTSYGASVQVIGGAFSLGPSVLDLGLDYAFTRDFAKGQNNAFFDLDAGLGLPLGLSPTFFLTPAIDLHALLFAASPQGVATPAFGIGPRLSAGFRPAGNVTVELGFSYGLLVGAQVGTRTVSGGLAVAELRGTYSF